jgi:hypothetical protein
MLAPDAGFIEAKRVLTAPTGLATAILTTRNSVTTQWAKNTENVRTAAENTTIFRDFQAEYEGGNSLRELQLILKHAVIRLSA